MTGPVAHRILRACYLAGRGIPVSEIAKQTSIDADGIRRAFNAAGIEHYDVRGPVAVVHLPLDPFLPDIDEVGHARRMNRDQIARAILCAVLREGAATINKILDRGEM